MLPGCFQQVQGSVGVDGEIDHGGAGRPIMRRLGRCVDHQRNLVAVLGKEVSNELLIPDVTVYVDVRLAEFGLKLLLLPPGGCLGPKEVLTHVVVDSNDGQAKRGEVSGGFRPDEAGRAGDYGNTHDLCSLSILVTPMLAAGRPSTKTTPIVTAHCEFPPFLSRRRLRREGAANQFKSCAFKIANH